MATLKELVGFTIEECFENPDDESPVQDVVTGGVPSGTCVCTICNQLKDNSHFSFYKKRRTKDGFRLRVNQNCRECANIRSKERNVLHRQHNKPKPGTPCDCCGKSVDKHEIDHCHVTKVFRGFLCKDCNVGQGKFGDGIDGLLKAVKYQSRTDPNVLPKLKLLIGSM